MGLRPQRNVILRAATATVLALGLISAPPATAAPPANANAAPPTTSEVEHPRQDWMRASTAGLFLHWGMFTAPQHLDCAEWERDVTGGGWTPDYWVDEARKLGASYIVLATFHSRLGYARPWPSKIPGSCAHEARLPRRAGQGRQGEGRPDHPLHDRRPAVAQRAPGIETLDSAAYSAYKGQQVDLTTRDGFGEFSYDLFFEVMENYPDLAGFWIDNDNAYWERNQPLRADPREAAVLVAEQQQRGHADHGHGQQRAEDRHDAVLRLPAGRVHADAAADRGRLQAADHRRLVVRRRRPRGRLPAVSTGRYITNAGSSMKSLMAETPMVNGKFPPQQEAFNNFMAQWVPPIRESLYGTEGGGYMYGGMQPGFWNDGAHGVVTVEARRTDPVRARGDPAAHRLRSGCATTATR